LASIVFSPVPLLIAGLHIDPDSFGFPYCQMESLKPVLFPAFA